VLFTISEEFADDRFFRKETQPRMNESAALTS